MKLIPADQVQKTVQIMLTFIESDDAKIPGSMADGIFSGKSLLRGLLNGQLGIVQLEATAAPKPPAPPKVEVPVEEVPVEEVPVEEVPEPKDE